MTTGGATLPAPGPEARARSAALGDRIRAEIERAGGALGFERFMELALYAPGLGYYSAGPSPLGATGDFVTAPEISPLFARCLARPIADALDALGGGDLLEVGAGSGALAAELLPRLADAPTAPAHYLILERSAGLAGDQRARIHPTDDPIPVRWLEDLPPPGFTGVVIANELLDALAVTRFRRVGDEVRECCVARDEDGFQWTDRPAGELLRESVERLEAELGGRFPDGYQGEIGEARSGWVRAVAERLGRGLVLIVDYGYPRAELYHPQRDRGTLACHYRHRRHDDPLALVGLQDISVHVDFTALARTGLEAGLALAGFTTQSQFLLSCGLLDLLDGFEPGTPDFVRLTTQVKRLTLPGEMGEVVKVMALTRGFEGALSGFGERDLRDRLVPA